MRAAPRSQSDSHRHGWAGLVMLLVVMVIILILMTAGPGGGTLKQASTARKQGKQLRAELDMRQVALMVSQYHLTHGEYPTTIAEAGLSSLPQFRGELGERTRLRVIDDRNGPKRVEVTIPGDDGELGTEDDETESADLPL